MSDDFERIHRELGEIRRRARSIEGGAVRGDELKQHAREIADTADRLVRIVEDVQRAARRALREDSRGG
jgi:chemotaxis regulatin CheY-phosphate phosphatase CheZ